MKLNVFVSSIYVDRLPGSRDERGDRIYFLLLKRSNKEILGDVTHVAASDSSLLHSGMV